MDAESLVIRFGLELNLLSCQNLLVAPNWHIASRKSRNCNSYIESGECYLEDCDSGNHSQRLDTVRYAASYALSKMRAAELVESKNSAFRHVFESL